MNQRQIKILDRTYAIPELSQQLGHVHARLEEKAALVRAGKVAQPPRREVVEQKAFLGLFRREPLVREVAQPDRELSVAERYELVGQMVAHYDELIACLGAGKETYLGFLREVANGVEQVVQRKLQGLKDTDQRLKDLEQRVLAQGHAELAERAQGNRARLLRSIRVLAQAALLLLRKIELCRQGLLSLVDDQAQQARLLQKLREQLGLHQEMFLLEQEIAQHEHEVQQLAQVALRFEGYMRDYFGPLQGLLDEVSRVDGGLLKALHEIEALSADLEREQAAQEGLPGDDRALEWLVRAELRRDHVQRLLEGLEQAEEDLHEIEAELATQEADVGRALSNVEVLVRQALAPLRERPAALPNARAVVEVGGAPQPQAAQGEAVGGQGWLVENFVLAPAGRFVMGSPVGEPGRFEDEALREVELRRSFWVQRRCVTQRLWRELMGNHPSAFADAGPEAPVERVSWFDALAFANALSRAEGLPEVYALVEPFGTPGKDFGCKEVVFRGLDAPGYRLPTEAEWEYACRAGTRTATYAGPLVLLGEHHAPVLDPIAYYGGNSGVGERADGHDSALWPEMQRPARRSGTHPTGQKQANAWGLYDTLGNVWEWCHDAYAAYPTPDERKAAPDPSGPADWSGMKVIRGGAWNCRARLVRAAARQRKGPNERVKDQGFRLVRPYR